MQETRPKLLLADGSVTIRKVVELTFADEGIDVSAVADADSAMSTFVEIQPDIVLVDVGLSGTNGYQICEMIKQDEATRHIPVMLLVGSFEPFDLAEAERVEADGFLTKPFQSIRDLVARVWDLLGREIVPLVPIAGSLDGVERAAVTQEISDIENLYQSSFAETVEIEEFDTLDDLLGDSGMDDEMIEASYSSHRSSNVPAGARPEIEKVEPEKEFDWSPKSIIKENSVVKTESPGSVPKFVFDDTDELEILESGMKSPGGDFDNQEAVSSAASDFEDGPVRVSSASQSVSNADRAVPLETKDLDFNRGNVAGEPEINSPKADSDIRLSPDSAAIVAENPGFEDVSLHETITSEPVQFYDEEIVRESKAISPELIELIAQRLVEKLSDRVIREIAQDAVPRIAEKLIREALVAENKS